MRFKDKIVIITGGARGIGAETALKFAENGAKVAIFDLNIQGAKETAAQIQRGDGTCSTFSVDVTNREEVQNAVEKVFREYEKIDILINNAGTLKDNLSGQLTEDEWDFVLDVNLKGSFICSQAVQKYMVQQGYGKIVMTSSQAAVGAPGRVNYAAAKAGIQGMMKTLAIELGPYGINVNAVAPGFIETEMSKVSEEYAKRRGIENFTEYKKAMIQRNPIRRVGQPEDVANVILFLASEDADYVTGQVIYVSGAPVV
ncbi:SDR family NAD(P)-dependent oxidoreductase [Neobacillus sp. 179-C4.2 HS]|uniref:SDR family NAD(P)-dependent oxidoreductase n=1 Tax=Neobacillus driksii TaxID=3035913 RepID=A0ABV4YSK4_9BACI|nr:SDR family NAD(P)-dependent oxidoreductase [Neobacillus sp. 179.-C4.2 HS]MDP5195125.1 SDR family NAD(P)-dependent oxidoreductase [Neobacillus sp. 179.-C4.2 HS]